MTFHLLTMSVQQRPGQWYSLTKNSACSKPQQSACIPLSKLIQKTLKYGFNVGSQGVQIEGRRGGGWEV